MRQDITLSSVYSASATDTQPTGLRLSLPSLPHSRGFPIQSSLAAHRQGTKTTPPIDLQATPSCLHTDAYIFNEVLLHCSASATDWSAGIQLYFYPLIQKAYVFLSTFINRVKMEQKPK